MFFPRSRFTFSIRAMPSEECLIHGNQYGWYHGTYAFLRDRLPIGEKDSYRSENAAFRVFWMAGKC